MQHPSPLLIALSFVAGILAIGVSIGNPLSTIRAQEAPAMGAAPEQSSPHPDPAAEYLLHLNAEDYTTYTDPVYGFSFRYPKDFDLLTASWGDEEVVDVYHPTMALSIRVSSRPFDPDGELFAELASLPDDYEREPPEGAESTAVGWIDADVPVPGEHRSAYWFVAHDRIFEITMTAPDLDWLDTWMREFVSDSFRLMPPAHDS